MLKSGDLSFKDLNRNGVLDPYEDWRMPMEKRVADLLSRMTLEEKAGLMQITLFSAGALDDYIDQRHIRRLILRDDFSARELAARANNAQGAAEKARLGVPVILAGDYNVVPAAQDIYPTRSLDKNALIQPQSREAYARLLSQGWTDALRKLQPERPLWTFWDYERNRSPLDKGMRLDHFLLSPSVCERLADGSVDRWVRERRTRATTLLRGSCSGHLDEKRPTMRTGLLKVASRYSWLRLAHAKRRGPRNRVDWPVDVMSSGSVPAAAAAH